MIVNFLLGVDTSLSSATQAADNDRQQTYRLARRVVQPLHLYPTTFNVYCTIQVDLVMISTPCRDPICPQLAQLNKKPNEHIFRRNA